MKTSERKPQKPKSPQYIIFAEAVKVYNGRISLLQITMAEMIGISSYAIRTWETGKYLPTSDNLRKLLDFYLKQGAFTKNKELEEARELWRLWVVASYGENYSDPKDVFDEAWFRGLLQEQENEQVREDERQKDEENLPATEEVLPVEPNADETNNGITELPQAKGVSRRKLLRELPMLLIGIGIGLGGGIVWDVFENQAHEQMIWSRAGDMQIPHTSACATTLLDGTVLVTGGMPTVDTYTTICELFNPITGTWAKTRGSMQKQRAQHTATLLLDGRVLVAGGYAYGRSRMTVELYDPTTGLWTLSAHLMSINRVRHCATALNDGRVLITGGANQDSAEVYDPASDNWIPAGIMATPRSDHVAVRLFDGRVLVAGGTVSNDVENQTSSTQLYDPEKNTWATVPDMHFARSYFTGVLLPDGRVLVLGGRVPRAPNVSDSFFSPTAEVFDPSTEHWTLVTPMHRGRENTLGNGAVLLDNGTVLVVDGDKQGTSEVYDPISDTWSIPYVLHVPLYLCSTALLHDGRALATGGQQYPQGLVTKATMLYQP